MEPHDRPGPTSADHQAPTHLDAAAVVTKKPIHLKYSSFVPQNVEVGLATIFSTSLIDGPQRGYDAMDLWMANLPSGRNWSFTPNFVS
jgi:hypothetical protein